MLLKIALATALALVSSSVFAAELTNLQTVLTDSSGAAISDPMSNGQQTPGKKCGEPGEKPCLTVALAVVHALLDCAGPPLCPTQHPSGDDKYQRFQLAHDILTAVHPTASVQELALIKTLVGEMFSPLVVGQVWDALDPKAKK